MLLSTFFWTVPPENVKNLSKHAILDLVRFTPGGITRTELAKQMGLTRAAITTIINDLETAKLVKDCDEASNSRHKPVVLEIDHSHGYVIGIDIGATHVEIILANLAATVIRDVEFPIDIEQKPSLVLEQVDEGLQKLLAESNLSIKDIQAVGVGVPGPVVRNAGLVSAPPIMPGWDGFPIRDTLEKKWGCPVSLNNDADLGVLGEWAYGAGRGERNLIYVKVGHGIGSGILLDGQLYHGTTGSAGEIGHITIDENGPLCTCGNKGCLEAIAGGMAICRKAREKVIQGHRTELVGKVSQGKLGIQDILSSARRGDLFSQQLISEAGVHLGTALAGLVNLFNPSMIIVGGGMAQMGDLLLEPIRKAIQQRSLLVASQAVRVNAALLGRRSSAMGGVVQANSRVLHQFADKL